MSNLAQAVNTIPSHFGREIDEPQLIDTLRFNLNQMIERAVDLPGGSQSGSFVYEMQRLAFWGLRLSRRVASLERLSRGTNKMKGVCVSELVNMAVEEVAEELVAKGITTTIFIEAQEKATCTDTRALLEALRCVLDSVLLSEKAEGELHIQVYTLGERTLCAFRYGSTVYPSGVYSLAQHDDPRLSKAEDDALHLQTAWLFAKKLGAQLKYRVLRRQTEIEFAV